MVARGSTCLFYIISLFIVSYPIHHRLLSTSRTAFTSNLHHGSAQARYRLCICSSHQQQNRRTSPRWSRNNALDYSKRVRSMMLWTPELTSFHVGHLSCKWICGVMWTLLQVGHIRECHIRPH